MTGEKGLSLRDILDRSLLYRLAGPRSFGRGVDYFEGGHVHSLVEQDGVVSAKVSGKEEYAVRLWVESGTLSASCTCPMYASGNFCKHCVAAGLAIIEVQRKGEAEPGAAVVNLDDVREYLRDLDKDALVELILEQAKHDDRLQERLLLQAATTTGKGPDLAFYRGLIEDAVWADDFVDYGSMHDYASNIQNAVGSIRELLEEGYAKEVIELSEYSLTVVEGQMGLVDDSGGYMGGILHSLQELHHEACVLAKPNPEELARQLLRWELQDKWGVFYGAVRQYADVLGDRGMAEYRQLAEAEWEQVLPLAPGDDSSERSGIRYRITSIMKILAQLSGDVEAQVQVMSRDLSCPYRFLEIAEVYQKTGQMDKAIHWAERGLAEFPQRQEGRLRVFLAEGYQQKGRHDEALELVWAGFADVPRLPEYQQLKSHAERVDKWPQWRVKALGFLREKLDHDRRKVRDSRWMGMLADHSEPVRILLWEGDVEEAWHEAQGGGCSDDLWLQLARRREKGHPLDSLHVYQAQVDPIVERKTYDAYEEAVRLIQSIGGILTRLGKGQEFAAYLEGVKGAHRRKRNFMQLLERNLGRLA